MPIDCEIGRDLGAGHLRPATRADLRSRRLDRFSDASNSTSSPPTSQTVPSGNTDVNVATIDFRSGSLML